MGILDGRVDRIVVWRVAYGANGWGWREREDMNWQPPE